MVFLMGSETGSGEEGARAKFKCDPTVPFSSTWSKECSA